MRHITEIHEEVYEFLTNINHDSDTNLRFTLRRSNRESRLDEGYWFYGNDSYLAVSFWSGNDWKNRTPNIIFVVLPNGETYLEINTSDSKIKKLFVEQHLASNISGLEPSGKRFFKKYPGNAFLESLRMFLVNDKRIIDEIVRGNQSFFEDAPDDERIGFIDPDDFAKMKQKVDQYRANLREETFQEANKSLRSIRIKGYGPIKDIGLYDIPEKTQWIFLTGENGTGKTNVLRGIALALTNKLLSKTEQNDNPDFEIIAELYSNRGSMTRFSRLLNENINPKKLWISGFAAFGASRLITNNSGLSSSELSKYRRKDGLLYSLFNPDGILLDLLYKQNRWNSDRKHKSRLKERFNNIREVLYEIIPNLHTVVFDESNNIPITKYVEEDENGEPYPEQITFHKLASGIKSMVAMFGDMMCRLFDQQPEKADPSELTGIVLIDEIDIHLHPKLQKKLVEELTKTFRNIQFIATTHSPIPLLGAPLDSCFFKVERKQDAGVEVINLSDIDVFHLLPNSILTSDLFGMNSLFNRNTKSEKPIRTENYYNEIIINDEVRNELKTIAENLKGRDETSE